MDRGVRRVDFEEEDMFRRILCYSLAMSLMHVCGCKTYGRAEAGHPSAREGEQRGSSRAT